jgi:hypothetical protein
MRLLKQSTAVDIVIFMTDSADHITGKTGLTLTITASKAAAAFASITPTVTELVNGWYKLALTTSHTDTIGDLALHVTGTGADPLDTRVGQVMVALPDDIAAYLDTEIAAIKAKTDNLPADPADASDIASSFTTVNTKLDTIDDFLDTEIAAIKAKTDNLPAAPAATGDIPSASTVAAAVVAEAIETGYTLKQSMRLMLAALAGKLSGAATTTVTIRDATDTKNRITATVDTDGNRTAVVHDVT